MTVEEAKEKIIKNPVSCDDDVPDELAEWNCCGGPYWPECGAYFLINSEHIVFCCEWIGSNTKRLKELNAERIVGWDEIY